MHGKIQAFLKTRRKLRGNVYRSDFLSPDSVGGIFIRGDKQFFQNFEIS